MCSLILHIYCDKKNITSNLHIHYTSKENIHRCNMFSSGGSTIAVASLCSVVSIAQKEERKKERQRATKGKKLQSMVSKKKERGFSSILVRRALIGS